MAVPTPPTEAGVAHHEQTLGEDTDGKNAQTDANAVTTITVTTQRLFVRTLTLHAKKS